MTTGRRRGAALSLLLAAAVLATGVSEMPRSGGANDRPQTPGSLPDLAVRRDGFAFENGVLRLVVENRGAVQAPRSVVEVRDRPFAGGLSGTSSPYLPVRGERAIWVEQEPAGEEAVRLALAFGSGLEPLVVAGTLAVTDAGPLEIFADPEDGVRAELAADGSRVSWQVELPQLGAVQTMLLRVPVAGATTPRAHLTLDPESTDSLPRIVTACGVIREGEVELALDCLERPCGRAARVPVPALAPGERADLCAEFPGGALDEVSAWCDPDDVIAEIREGNNVSSWRPDSDWSLAALHIHSCFSEGAGSLDWQVQQACRSGYDLIWWSEHDWRMSCVEHDEVLDFTEGGRARVRFIAKGQGARADMVVGEELTGGRAVRLAALGSGFQRAQAVLGSQRKRFTYALASRVDVVPRVLASSFGPGDVLTIGCDLSLHPGERRRLLYRFTHDGTDSPESASAISATSGSRVFVAALPARGWVELPLHLSRDAEQSWPNGLDDSLVRIWFELTANSEAEVQVDRLEFRHEIRGTGLLAIQREWVAEYPNVHHEIGGEVSLERPHMGRYGGDPDFVSYDDVWETDRANPVTRAVAVVRRVHETGGVVSWCHPFGVVSDRSHRRIYESPRYWEPIFAGEFGGVDALEVGYRRRAGQDLGEYLALWDRAGAAGFLLTGIGVNDSHSIQWGSWENNFGTWLRAPAENTPALLRALRAGRAFFGDPLRFRGRIELRCGDSTVGDVLTGAGPREVSIHLAAAGENRKVRLVADGELLHEWTGIGGDAQLVMEVDSGAASVVRAELWDEHGEPLAFTNPLYFDSKGTLRRR